MTTEFGSVDHVMLHMHVILMTKIGNTNKRKIPFMLILMDQWYLHPIAVSLLSVKILNSKSIVIFKSFLTYHTCWLVHAFRTAHFRCRHFFIDNYFDISGGVAPMLGRNDKVEFYSNGKWSNGPRLPNILSSHTSHIIDSDIYVFGGLIADSGRIVFISHP